MKKYLLSTLIAFLLLVFYTSPHKLMAFTGGSCIQNATHCLLPLEASDTQSLRKTDFIYSYNRVTNQIQLDKIWLLEGPSVYSSLPDFVMIDVITKLLESSFDILAITDSSVSHNVEIIVPRCWKATIINIGDSSRYTSPILCQAFYPCTSGDCCRAMYTLKKLQGKIRICDKVLTNPAGSPCGTDVDPTNPLPCTSVCNALMQVRTYEQQYGKSCNAVVTVCDNPCFWQTGGNSSITSDNFIGPVNGEDFIIKTMDSTSQYLNEVMRVTNYGYVGIGTKSPVEKLDVDGNLRVNGEIRGIYPAYFDSTLYVKGMIKTSEVLILNPSEFWPWPDYVFSKNYKLKPLAEVEEYIKANNSLPEMPNKEEVKENGVKLNEMQALLLKKIEEMTLYMIELKKENEALKKKMEALEKKTKSQN